MPTCPPADVELLERLKKTGNPLVLTINGKAEVVVQDAEAYQLLERVQTIEGIQRGLADVKARRAKASVTPAVPDRYEKKGEEPN